MLAALVGLAACAARPVEVGRAAFAEHCVRCHGVRADGRGPLADLVPGGVPDLRGLARRNGGTFPEAQVIRVVTRVSDLHRQVVAMPDFGALLQAAPAVYIAPDGERIETDVTVLAIAAYLRSIQI